MIFAIMSKSARFYLLFCAVISAFLHAVKLDEVERFKDEIDNPDKCEKKRNSEIFFIFPAKYGRCRRNKAQKCDGFAVKITEIVFILNLVLAYAENKVIFFSFENIKSECRNGYSRRKPDDIDISVHFSSFLPINGSPLNMNNTAKMRLSAKMTSDVICVEKYA